VSGRSALAATLALVITAGSAPVWAGEPGDVEVSTRLQLVTGALEREAPRARVWQDTWTFGFAGLALTQGAVALAATNDGVRVTAVSGGIKATIGLVARLVLPFSAPTAAETLRRAGERTPAERLVKLRLAESLLRRCAQEERFGRSWAPLLLGVALNR
jgi:hypothetical protein